MLNPRKLPPRRRSGFTPAPIPLRRAPTLVPEEPPEAPGRRTLVRRVVSFIVVVGLAVGVVGSAAGTQGFKGATAAGQAVAAEQASAVLTWWDRHLRQGAVVDELDAMRAERDALAIEVMALRSIEREHARLVRQLQMAAPLGLDGVVGRVIARPTTGRRTLRLDIGTDAGVALGQTVIGHQGLIGQVVDTGPDWTDVLVATDPLHGAAVFVEDTEIHGTLRGTGDGLAMDHVIAGTDVPLGAVVLTSGEGGVHPRGIPVGTVLDVGRDTGPMLRVDVDAPALAGLMTEVMVVTSQRPVSP